MKTFKFLALLTILASITISCTEEPVLPAGDNVKTETNDDRFK